MLFETRAIHPGHEINRQGCAETEAPVICATVGAKASGEGSNWRGVIEGLAERFGDQVARLLGAAEHRSARMRGCVSEERRSQQRRRAARAPKLPAASP